MRKVVLFMHASLDGFVGGPNGELDWISHDDEIFQDVTDMLEQVDAALYGRTTYQMMEGYWPTVPSNPASTPLELHHAQWVEQVDKIVFSTTLPGAEWNNTRLIKENIAEEIAQLKTRPGKDLMIFGSPRLSYAFMKLGLVDEYRINLNPVILGAGIPLFKDPQDRVNLQLRSAKTYACGVVGLRYATT